MRFEQDCNKAQALLNASASNTHFFTLDSDEWWKALPADMIPVPGGIYTDESWNAANERRKAYVAGKVLGDLPFVDASSEAAQLNAVIEVMELDCGKVEDSLSLWPVLLADFNNDGVAELLVEGSRLDRSNTCHLGSGNSLGTSFAAVLEKVGPDAPVRLLHVPGIN